VPHVDSSAATGLVAVGAALLILGGAPKVVRPGDTARALARMGLPSARLLVRGGGAVETAIGLAALLVGGAVPAALVAASYVGFSVVVLRALRSGDALSSCGCFGRPDTPPTRAHVAVTGGLALGAGWAAAASAPALAAIVADAPGTGLPLLLLVAVTTGLAWLALAVLPVLSAPAPSVRTLPLVASETEPAR
jgi:hypothetical protein